ncbi:MAG: hypothetical protein AB7O68_03650 [Pirellulales bacterium]
MPATVMPRFSLRGTRLYLERLEDRTLLTVVPYADPGLGSTLYFGGQAAGSSLFNEGEEAGTASATLADMVSAGAGSSPSNFAGANASFDSFGVAGRSGGSTRLPADWEAYLLSLAGSNSSLSFYSSNATGRPFAAASDVLFATGNPFNIG